MNLPFIGKKENEEKKVDDVEGGVIEGKYDEPCALCGKSPTDKKWGGQFFHKKCFRKIKKGARGML
ncbi:MAG: hypothetical protein ACOX1V_04380 [Candidatus Iainarchaeum sp.]|jgi:hypothetical protein|nr:MAG: hypothetical protein BWY55_00430 [archaeon ADurb.Bin336]